MITIQLDFARRMFVVCADGSPVASFRTYKGAADLLKECKETPREIS